MARVTHTFEIPDGLVTPLVEEMRNELGGLDEGDDNLTDREVGHKILGNVLRRLLRRRARREDVPVAVTPFRAIVEQASLDSRQALLDIKTAEQAILDQFELDVAGI